MGAKIYGATTIGPYCLAGGEIKNSVLMGYSNKGHDGYLGDSVIGSWCNLGAGTSNSNLKNNAGMVKMWSRQKNDFINAGNKCGLIMGDYSRCAINTSFNTGTVAGISCNIFGNPFPPKYIEDFTWGNEKYIFEKAVSDINNWKKLKGHEINDEEIQSLKIIYQKKYKQ
jgi:N-acetylglucosamine-1-phosphate uridyltransferase (contains nucleotidyltransferase and I-patch acetyltransferase domains)